MTGFTNDPIIGRYAKKVNAYFFMSVFVRAIDFATVIEFIIWAERGGKSGMEKNLIPVDPSGAHPRRISGVPPVPADASADETVQRSGFAVFHSRLCDRLRGASAPRGEDGEGKP